ncbi:hypothetical protein L198_07157 [Cryptococcus wingfieldii CBS 7118]|uniref:Uncharacterized protein n=1 Tax=Cryptococcus wingfieldii CBS 7118 TaxID=1295528 RepID=A0A1E3IED6_9TREE|nr:hypothetical protein L198_07157 [Cryptococcus wingfieldii CBS 7118]ODN86795.1 hypothetical protein L198_07157 [Cryptococcus wingfieldii CBS 7118]
MSSAAPTQPEDARPLPVDFVLGPIVNPPTHNVANPTAPHVANPTAPHVANPTAPHVANPASLSLVPVPRWRELVPVLPTAWPGWTCTDGFQGWLRGIFEDIAGQDKRAYNKWVDNEFRKIDSLPLPLAQANDMRSAAKKKIDDHRRISFWATAIIPTFVFMNSIVVCLVGGWPRGTPLVLTVTDAALLDLLALPKIGLLYALSSSNPRSATAAIKAYPDVPCAVSLEPSTQEGRRRNDLRVRGGGGALRNADYDLKVYGLEDKHMYVEQGGKPREMEWLDWVQGRIMAWLSKRDAEVVEKQPRIYGGRSAPLFFLRVA